MKKILVVDDNEDILNLVTKILTKNNYVVDCKVEIEYEDISQFKGYDLILLDVMLGIDYDGFDICQKIRNEILTPIVFLTAKTSDEDLIIGFEVGADDYIKKPFSPKELLARVEAHIRRDERKEERRDILISGSINIYKDEKAIYVMNKKIELTNKEFELINLLAENPNKIFSQDEVYDKIYSIDSDALQRGVSEFVYQIRKKFKEVNINPIKTVRGMGYKWKIKE
ncbi:MAG: response regulator transcription factor [Treponema sp.]